MPYYAEAFTVQNTVISAPCSLSSSSSSPWCKVERRRMRRRRDTITCASSTTATTTAAAEEEETAAAAQTAEHITDSNDNRSISKSGVFVADSLDGRLLCASQCAYDVSNKCYFRGVGFKAGTVAKRISKGRINSLLIGQTGDGIVIGFRGTLANSPLDWLQNAALFLSPVDDFPNNDSIKVHTGFYRAVKSLWKPLKSTLKDMIQTYYREHPLYINDDNNNQTTTDADIDHKNNNKKNNDHIPPPKIYLTGHSKGGAMASIAAMMMRQSSSIPNPTYVCTFASVKPGNSQFRDIFNKEVNQTSYEAYLDIIPFLPPAKTMMAKLDKNMTDMVDSLLWSETTVGKKDKYKWDYETVGSRKYIAANGDITMATNELDDIRIRDIEQKTFLSFKRFRSAHCSSCPGQKENDYDDGSGEPSQSECDGLYFSSIASDICEECGL
eukprot:CAMPEP_0197823468 /NCGR_PEP_ID=MMETSP1437-20131217/820_1 /TAXON_ID=49252 ORGANISM="Eucampia antarctica, Strain CCMP1452" /NCGR_SAMPLE_ID=MMETSP1437 /ASSEMBLY_ACC=CAM_ASM_001096 /LENGTH=439 /DNA_ID=CAMNT_0043422667 /DNA_START=272 /DNA_END=1591 /DNA_ORIENTATION=-